MASCGVQVSAAGSANETPKIPDNMGDWLWGVYRFATDRNDFWRNLILNLGLFAAGVWLARNWSDIDPMAPQPGVYSQVDKWNPVLNPNLPKNSLQSVTTRRCALIAAEV
ncbi:mitochondrial import receptor subunit TOM6 homolog [Macaca thibetana thibetana]|uniref:mitochondrial import receptor subunit TOM6 homolog n=1 Tax=Macaca thibetana thibetana TaxID=257877 RepID=UPI0021BC98A5|nr:mitochondrial import receptor subunit TOM6 homolog [Macaca thibetana thibetana]